MLSRGFESHPFRNYPWGVYKALRMQGNGSGNTFLVSVARAIFVLFYYFVMVMKNVIRFAVLAPSERVVFRPFLIPPSSHILMISVLLTLYPWDLASSLIGLMRIFLFLWTLNRNWMRDTIMNDILTMDNPAKIIPASASSGLSQNTSPEAMANTMERMSGIPSRSLSGSLTFLGKSSRVRGTAICFTLLCSFL